MDTLLLDRGWDLEKSRLARRAVGQEWRDTWDVQVDALLRYLGSHPDTPADLEAYRWEIVAWQDAGAVRAAVVDGLAVIESEAGRLDSTTPVGDATMPWWCGWRADERLAVLCLGPGQTTHYSSGAGSNFQPGLDQ